MFVVALIMHYNQGTRIIFLEIQLCLVIFLFHHLLTVPSGDKSSTLFLFINPHVFFVRDVNSVDVARMEHTQASGHLKARMNIQVIPISS